MSAIRVPLSQPSRPSHVPAHGQPQVIFTRQLWERTMPATDAAGARTNSRRSSTTGDREPEGSRARRLPSVVPPQPQPPPPLPPPPRDSQPSRTHSRVSETPLTPEESPPFQESRKRSADALDLDSDLDGSSSPTQARDAADDSLTNFCLCQPEPKVPRPRNAFILYRQTHQAAVVAQHPGFANPDISKIIGEQWRNESEAEKNRWKAYAEEEKLQHQQRYPSYRYQPRRPGRRASVSSDTGPPSAEVRKCPKCGGRNIVHHMPNTPSSAGDKQDKSNSPETSPSSAFTDVVRSNTITLPPPTPSSTTTPSTRYLPMLNNLSLSSPQSRRMAQSRPPQSFAPMHRPDTRKATPPVPDTKRRRFESPQGTYVMSTGAMPQRQAADPGTPFPFLQQQQPKAQALQNQSQMTAGRQYHLAQGRRESLPPATEILRGQQNGSGVPSSMMGPPPRPIHGYSQHRQSQGHVRPPVSELSLTLPPLQTMGAPSRPPNDRLMPGEVSKMSVVDSSRETDTRSLAQKIMSISFQHKIGILRRIMPPLPASKGKARATIIAIEGDSAEAASNLTDWLEESLSRDSDMEVMVIDGPKPSGLTGDTELKVEDLFKTVVEWHAKNKEVIELVTGSGSARKDSAKVVPSTAASANEDQTMASAELEKSMMDIDNDDNGDDNYDGPKDQESSKLIILFRTYTLTASNLYASGIPIRDVYRPDDHWQWTATLWRGILGPDLTIYIKDSGSQTTARGEVAKGGVEIVEEPKMNYKFMAIHRNPAADGKGDRNSCDGIEAGTLRRLGFEVGEWVRSAAVGKTGNAM